MTYNLVDGRSIFLQNYFIPTKSVWVRWCMYQAELCVEDPNPFLAYVIPICLVVTAVALSFFNSISYFLQIPFKVLLKIVEFDPLGAVTKGLIRNGLNGIKSLIFVSMGMTFVIMGIIFPKEFFVYFAPDSFETEKQQLRRDNALYLQQFQKAQAIPPKI